jgi:hypothetical protein
MEPCSRAAVGPGWQKRVRHLERTQHPQGFLEKIRVGRRSGPSPWRDPIQIWPLDRIARFAFILRRTYCKTRIVKPV